MRINVILIGLSSAPIGGYKVIYRYADDLAALGHDVTVYHCDQHAFRLPERKILGGVPSELVRLLRRQPRYEHILPERERPSWFDLDPGVESFTSPGLAAGDIRDADATIATACTTAPFVAALPRSAGAKFYFIQHYEDWTAGSDYVDETWRLPLTRVVIARWLQRKGEELGVETIHLPNAIDRTEFPPGPPITERPLAVSALLSDTPWKRTDLVIEVLEGLKPRIPEIEAHTFGTCPRPAELPDWVNYTRSPDPAQLTRIYQQSRVYLCASDAEGWHLPPAEALACGSAAASTDIDGVREYADGIARFSPVGDAEALLHNVINLLSDSTACQAAVTTFGEYASNHTPADAARALLGILESSSRAPTSEACDVESAGSAGGGSNVSDL